MARARNHKNGRLEEAMATLAQNMATLLQTQVAMQAEKRETDKELAELRREQSRAYEALRKDMTEFQRRNEERFARIEATLREHSRILAEHTLILERLPEAVREKIGFKAPP